MASRTKPPKSCFSSGISRARRAAKQEIHRHALAIAKLLIQEYGVFGTAQGVYLWRWRAGLRWRSPRRCRSKDPARVHPTNEER